MDLRPALFFLLIAVCGLVAAATIAVTGNDSPWRHMAEQDLATIRDTIRDRHPGPLDARNPAFAQWNARGYDEAMALAAKATDFPGYEKALREYVNGFHDGHLSLNLDMQATRAWWPGFVMAWRDNAWRVHSVASDVASPRVGEVLVACDGIAAEDLYERRVVPFYGNPEIRSSRVVSAPRLLVDIGTDKPEAPSNCTFRGANGEHKRALDWRRTAWDVLSPLMQAARTGTPPAVGVRSVAGNGTWVSLPSFTLHGAEIEQTKAVLAQLARHRDSDYMVVDVRGNGGGSSYWGSATIAAIYGEAFGKWMDEEATRKQANTYVEFRVSQATADHFRSELPRIAQGAGKDSQDYRYFDRIVASLDAAVKRGDSLLDDRAIQREVYGAPKAIAAPRLEPAYHGRVFFLTDANCASACLDFADLMLCAPNVVQVGGETSGDTAYMDVARRPLPSGTGTVVYATKVYRDRARGHNETYVPAAAWSGDAWNTAGIEAWIADMQRSGKVQVRKPAKHC